MPWLTYHMAWPMILLTGWLLGQIVEALLARLAEGKPGRAALSLIVVAVFILAAFNALRALFGATPPFQGTELLQLQATAAFLLPLICVIASLVVLAYLMREDLTSLGIVALFLLVLVTLFWSVINGATWMSLTSTVGTDPLLIGSSRAKFIAALVALIACGSAGGGSSSPATCSGCEGALCGGRCTDLSTALAADVEGALPSSACVAETAISGIATLCSAQTCPAGGAAGCTVALSWSPVALGRDTHLLEGTVTGTSSVDAHAPGTSCTAIVTATLSYRAAAAFACAPGSETATFGTATTKVESSSVTPDAGCAARSRCTRCASATPAGTAG